MKPNKWLEDSTFLENIEFEDKYYLETLFFKISSFIKNAPIPIVSTFDPLHKSIYIIVGEYSTYFPVDINIAYFDMITLIRRWVTQFYPHYEITVSESIPYTDQEIVDYLVGEKGMNLNDALLETKEVSHKEIGVLEKVYIKKDEFVLNVNGEKEIRTPYKPGEIYPLSKFMKDLRELTTKEIPDSDLIASFINDNSKKIFSKGEDVEIIVSYSGKQMINFFDINYVDLKDYELKEISEFKLKWKNFIIHFNSKILKNDCLALYNKKCIEDENNV